MGPSVGSGSVLSAVGSGSTFDTMTLKIDEQSMDTYRHIESSRNAIIFLT